LTFYCTICKTFIFMVIFVYSISVVFDGWKTIEFWITMGIGVPLYVALLWFIRRRQKQKEEAARWAEYWMQEWEKRNRWKK